MNLDFPITEYPKWREKKSQFNLGVEEMLKGIVDYMKTFEGFETRTDRTLLQQKLREIRFKYIVHTQIEEDIGVKTQEETLDIIVEIEGEEEDSSTKRKLSSGSDDSTIKRLKSKDENSNLLDTNNGIIDVVENKENLDFDNSSANDFVQPPTSQEMVVESLQETDVSDRKKQETMNLYKGLVYLEKRIFEENCSTKEEEADLNKLLDVKECIQKTHKILTKDVLSDEMIPGQFSTRKRYGEFDNEIYHYPHFKTKNIAEAAVQSIVDEYHKHLVNIKKEMQKPMTLELLKKIFKVATSFLFSFLQLHPFSDGNGRLGRLLCSYVLELFSPFPTAIYNVFSSTRHGDYVQALVNTRIAMNDTDIQKKLKNEQVSTENEAINIAYKYLAASPSDLCALIIESNWCTWRELMSINQ